MTSPVIESFITQALARTRTQTDPVDCVLALAPLMFDLVEHQRRQRGHAVHRVGLSAGSCKGLGDEGLEDGRTHGRDLLRVRWLRHRIIYRLMSI